MPGIYPNMLKSKRISKTFWNLLLDDHILFVEFGYDTRPRSLS